MPLLESCLRSLLHFRHFLHQSHILRLQLPHRRRRGQIPKKMYKTIIIISSLWGWHTEEEQRESYKKPYKFWKRKRRGGNNGMKAKIIKIWEGPHKYPKITTQYLLLLLLLLFPRRCSLIGLQTVELWQISRDYANCQCTC